MAAYLLRPRDGARDIKIPAGKTTIGRGPFLGVTTRLLLLIIPQDLCFNHVFTVKLFIKR